MDLHRTGARNSPKQAKNKIIQKDLSFQLAPLFIVRFVCLVMRLWDWTEYRESHKKSWDIGLVMINKKYKKPYKNKLLKISQNKILMNCFVQYM